MSLEGWNRTTVVQVMNLPPHRSASSSGVIDRNPTGTSWATTRRSVIELRPQCEWLESNQLPRVYQTRALTVAPHSRGALCGTRTHILWLRGPALILLSYQSEVKRHGPPAWARAVMAVTTRVRAYGPIRFMVRRLATSA